MNTRYVRVALIGSGTGSDPYRARQVPSYNSVLDSIPALTSVVLVPFGDEPPDQADATIEQIAISGGAVVPVVIGLTPAGQTAWWTRLDARYVEHAGEYRPVAL